MLSHALSVTVITTFISYKNKGSLAITMKYLADLRTQDNQCTSSPIFCIFKDVKIFGMDSGYSDDYLWISEDSEYFADDEESDILDKLEDNHDHTIIDEMVYEKRYYCTRPEFISVCFTQKGADDFIARNKHRHEEELYVSVESVYNNAEMKEILNDLNREAELKFGGVSV